MINLLLNLDTFRYLTFLDTFRHLNYLLTCATISIVNIRCLKLQIWTAIVKEVEYNLLDWPLLPLQHLIMEAKPQQRRASTISTCEQLISMRFSTTDFINKYSSFVAAFRGFPALENDPTLRDSAEKFVITMLKITKKMHYIENWWVKEFQICIITENK